MSNLAAVDTTPERKIPVVQPECVKVNSAGQVFREVFIRLPEGAIADDLKEFSIWKKVQNGQMALRKFDKLTIVAFDESWLVEAIVSEANDTLVSTSTPKMIKFQQRFEKLFSDGVYRVVWMGSGYIVERIRDSAKMSEVYPNVAIAERALVQMHPKRGV